MKVVNTNSLTSASAPNLSALEASLPPLVQQTSTINPNLLANTADDPANLTRKHLKKLPPHIPKARPIPLKRMDTTALQKVEMSMRFQHKQGVKSVQNIGVTTTSALSAGFVYASKGLDILVNPAFKMTHNLPSAYGAIKLYVDAVGPFVGPVSDAVGFILHPIQIAMTASVVNNVDRYIEGFKERSIVAKSSAAFFAEILKDLKNPLVSYDTFKENVEEKFNALASFNTNKPFDLENFIGIYKGSDTFANLPKEKKKEALLKLLGEAQFRKFLVNVRNEFIAFNYRSALIEMLESEENHLLAAIELQHLGLYTFLSPDDIPDGQSIDFTDIENVKKLLNENQPLKEKFSGRIKKFQEALKRDRKFIRDFNRKFSNIVQKRLQINFMLAERKEAEVQRREKLKTALDKVVSQVQQGVPEKGDSSKWLKEMHEQLRKLGIDISSIDRPINTPESLQKALKDETILASLIDQQVRHAETLSVLSRNALKSMAVDKAKAERALFNLEWIKTRVMSLPIMGLSITSLIFGILSITIGVTIPFWISIVGWVILGFSVAFLIASIIQIIRHKPRHFLENVLKLGFLRKSFVGIPVSYKQKHLSKVQHKLQVNAILANLIHARTMPGKSEELKRDIERAYQEIKKDLPRKVRKIWERGCKDSKIVQKQSFNALKKVVKKDIEKLTTEVIEMKISLKRSQERLRKISKKIAKAGLEDTLKGGYSLRQLFGMKPKNRTSPYIAQTFPEVDEEFVEKTFPKIFKNTQNPNACGLVEALVEIDRKGGMDFQTKQILNKIGLDIETVQENELLGIDSLEEELREYLKVFLGGDIDTIYEVATKDKIAHS